MGYICQLQDGYMLVEDTSGRLSAKYTGYPYPDTVKDNHTMLYELLKRHNKQCNMEWVIDNYISMKVYVMSCVYTGSDIDIDVLYDRMISNDTNAKLTGRDTKINDNVGKIYFIDTGVSYCALVFENVNYIYNIEEICNYFYIRYNYEDTVAYNGATSLIAFLPIDRYDIFNSIFQDSEENIAQDYEEYSDVVNSILSLVVKSNKIFTLVDTVVEKYSTYSLDIIFALLGMVDATEIVGRYFIFNKQGIDELGVCLDNAITRVSGSSSFSKKLIPLLRTHTLRKYDFDCNKLLWQVIGLSGSVTGGLSTTISRQTVCGIGKRMARKLIGDATYNKDFTDDEIKYFDYCLTSIVSRFMQIIDGASIGANSSTIILSVSVDIDMDACYTHLDIFKSAIDNYMLGFEPSELNGTALQYDMTRYFDSKLSDVVSYFIVKDMNGEGLEFDDAVDLPESSAKELMFQMYYDIDKYAIFKPELYKKIYESIKSMVSNQFDSYKVARLPQAFISKFGNLDLFARLYIKECGSLRTNIMIVECPVGYKMNFKFALYNAAHNFVDIMHVSDEEFENLKPVIIMEFIRTLLRAKSILTTGVKYISYDNIELNLDVKTQEVTVTYHCK